MPEEGRLILADDIKVYTSDGNISGKELSDLTDVDVDGVISSKDAYPMDPSNTTESISPNTFNFVRNLVNYRNSISDERILPEIYSGLEKIIDVVESNPELIRDFSSLQNHILTSLVSGIPEIAKYPKAMRLGAIQVDSQNLADDYAMEKFVIPAIGYILRLQDEGMIDALNGLGIPDKALEDEGIRQILLPIELREVNILLGERHMQANLETGIYNVTSNESLGKSPQEWLGEIAVRDYNDKNSNGYKFVYRENAIEGYGPITPWHNSWEKFVEGINENIQAGDDLTFFLIRYPTYLRGPPSGNLVPELTGQTAPYYSVLVGRGFGEAVFDVKAIYPTTPDPDRAGIHSEAFILTDNTSDNWLLPYRFGFWLKQQAFIDDYKNKPYNIPHVEVRRANGIYEIINLDQNLTQQKK